MSTEPTEIEKIEQLVVMLQEENARLRRIAREAQRELYGRRRAKENVADRMPILKVPAADE